MLHRAEPSSVARWVRGGDTAAIPESIPSRSSVALGIQKDSERDYSMSTVMTKDGVQIFYKDWGRGQPLVFHHGWPLSADDWDAQMMFFLDRGFRVIAHDRRGHGRSSQTETGNEMDTYAADVTEMVEKLDITDVIHIGH